MSLIKIVDKAIAELKDKKLPISVFLAASAADVVTTVFGVHKYGISQEYSRIGRHFMESYGPIPGLVLSETIIVPPLIATLILFGKGLAALWSPERLSVRRLLESSFLYAGGLLSGFSAAGNLIVYYQGPL